LPSGAGKRWIGTAVIPTFIAQRWFSPALPEQVQEEVMAQEEESI